MHILFFTLPNFFVTFLWLYIIYHYIYLSLISPLFSLQICSFLCKFVLSYLRALFFPLFFILPLCVFVSILCEYTRFCVIFCFLSILFHSFWTFNEFFLHRESLERERKNEDHTMLLVLRCIGEGYDLMILANAFDNEDHFDYFQHHIIKEFTIFFDLTIANRIPQGQCLYNTKVLFP